MSQIRLFFIPSTRGRFRSAKILEKHFQVFRNKVLNKKRIEMKYSFTYYVRSYFVNKDGNPVAREFISLRFAICSGKVILRHFNDINNTLNPTDFKTVFESIFNIPICPTTTILHGIIPKRPSSAQPAATGAALDIHGPTAIPAISALVASISSTKPVPETPRKKQSQTCTTNYTSTQAKNTVKWQARPRSNKKHSPNSSHR